MQLVVISGKLGGDPALRYLPDGTAVCNFNVAVQTWGKLGSGENGNFPTWWKVSVWGRQAEACNTHLRKGANVTVSGGPVADPETGGPRLWNANDGTLRASFELRANEVTFGGQANSGGDGQGLPKASVEVAPQPVDVADIPF